MRKAVVKAQETIGANRQRMVDELGNWEEWRDLSKQIRNHVLANLDAYLYQLSEKVMENGGKVYFAETAEEASDYIRKVALEKKCEEDREIQIHGNGRNRFKCCFRKRRHASH